MCRYFSENVKTLIMLFSSSCLHTDSNWYLGVDCDFQVHKVGFYAGLGIVAAIAVITVAFLTAYLAINKQTVKR